VLAQRQKEKVVRPSWNTLKAEKYIWS